MRVHNFNPGPAALPLSVIESIKQDLPNWQDTGMSVLEVSHRSKEYDALHNETKQLLKELYAIPENYDVLFIGGGATTQFAMVPMNLLANNQTGSYVITGAWAKKAYQEAGKIGKNAAIAATGEESNFNQLPDLNTLNLTGNERYVHVTSNNTIFGTQYREFPKLKVPMVCDMSSDILSHEVNVSNFDLIYAGAQKNMGPSGVTIIIGKNEVLESDPDLAPTYLRYNTHFSKNSLYNTAPVFPIYVVNKVLHWIKDNGGVSSIAAQNNEKAQALYQAMDQSDGFYKGTADKASRSHMNITFRLPSEDLEAKFIQVGKEAQFIGMKGHRSVGGIRVSTYNAVSPESISKLIDFMADFKKNN